MKRFQTLPSLLSALFLAGTFIVTGCNPGTISGPDLDADYSVQTEIDTETFSINANGGNEHNYGANGGNEHNLSDTGNAANGGNEHNYGANGGNEHNLSDGGNEHNLSTGGNEHNLSTGGNEHN